MADDNRALQIAVEANINRLQKSMAKTESIVRQTAQKIDRMGQQAFAKTEAAAEKAAKGIGMHFANVGKGIAAGFAGFLTAQGAQQLFARVATAVDRFDELGDTAQRLGTNAKFLVQWGAALNAAGGDMDAFNGAVDEFQTKIGAVIGNIGKTKATKSALSAIGISREDIANAGDLEQKLLLIADGLSRVSDRASRAAIADKLGLKPLLPLLEEGRAGVQRLAGEFDGLGDAAQEGVNATGDMADKLKTLQKELEYKSDNLFVKIAPMILQVIGFVSRLIDELNNPTLLRWMGIAADGPAKVTIFGATLYDESITELQKMQTELAELEKQRQALVGENLDPAERQYAADWLAQNQQELANIEQRIELLKTAIGTFSSGEGIPGGPPRGYNPDGRPPLGPSEEDLANAKEWARLEKEAARDAERIAEFYERIGTQVREILRDDIANRTNELLDRSVSRDAVPLEAISEAADAQRRAFTDALVYAFQSGDLKGAAVSFINFFTERMYRDLANSIYDALMKGFSDADSGGGGFLGSIIGAIGGIIGGGGNAAGQGFSSGFGSGAGSGRAIGGPVRAGQEYWVGERGPEPFVPKVDGRILSVQQAQAAMRGGGGGSNLQVNVINYGAPAAVEKRQSRDGAGNPRLDVILRPLVDSAVKSGMREGRYDNAQRDRTGLSPRVDSPI